MIEAIENTEDPAPTAVAYVVRFASNSALIEMTGPIDLPPEIQHVAALLGKQRPEVRELLRYALVLAMIDDEKAHITGTRIEA